MSYKTEHERWEEWTDVPRDVAVRVLSDISEAIKTLDDLAENHSDSEADALEVKRTSAAMELARTALKEAYMEDG